MNIIRAAHLGMCFGVRDAIALALDHGAAAPLTILGDLVHNPEVLARLRANGIASADDITRVETRTVMVTAHGASERLLASTRQRGLEVLEATCPLVRVAHRAVQQLVREGYHPVIIGQRGHVEVLGLTGDLDEFDVVLDEADVQALAARPRLGIAAQTTQPLDRVRHLVGLIRQRFPQSDIRFIDTVCQPTKLRQKAAVDLARQSDVVIVIGGANSNNTRELVATCRRHCPRVHQVQSASDLVPDWFAAAATVGLTAGTSTLESAIDAVDGRIRQIAAERADRAASAASSRR
jgi:4-hydroxy-3-methylbut-2-enyl diphosphate reductase